jgi:hypothetical protein
MAGGRGRSTRHVAVWKMHELDRVDRSGLGQLALVRVRTSCCTLAHHQLASCPQLLA